MIERDLYVEQIAVPVRIDLPQGSNVQQMKFWFRDFTPSGNPQIYFHKPSGAEIYNTASSHDFDVDAPYAVFDSTTQMTAESGQIKGQVRVIDSGSKILNSFPILLNVVESPITGNVIESKDELTVIDDALSEAESRLTTLDSLERVLQDGEAERVAAEQQRISSEVSRKEDENMRKSNERTRQSQESSRQSNESSRESAEATRTEEFEQMKSEFEGAIITASASTGISGSSAAVSVSGEGFNKHFAFELPRGFKGEKGDPGDASQVATSSVAGSVKPGSGLALSGSDGTLNVNYSAGIKMQNYGRDGSRIAVRTGKGIILRGSNIHQKAVEVNLGEGLAFESDGRVRVKSDIASFAGALRTYLVEGVTRAVATDMFGHQIITPCVLINRDNSEIVIDDGDTRFTL